MIGARVHILGTEIGGLVVGKQSYLGESDKYAVRYSDNAGPQERWFQGNQISFEGREIEENVVTLERKVA